VFDAFGPIGFVDEVRGGRLGVVTASPGRACSLRSSVISGAKGRAMLRAVWSTNPGRNPRCFIA
jgi:hypothetical protein